MQPQCSCAPQRPGRPLSRCTLPQSLGRSHPLHVHMCQHREHHLLGLVTQCLQHSALACRCRVHLMPITYRRIVHDVARSIRRATRKSNLLLKFAESGGFTLNDWELRTHHAHMSNALLDERVAVGPSQMLRNVPVALPWLNTASSSALWHSTLTNLAAETLVGNFAWFGCFGRRLAVASSSLTCRVENAYPRHWLH
jgi:hypothetical protein